MTLIVSEVFQDQVYVLYQYIVCRVQIIQFLQCLTSCHAWAYSESQVLKPD